MSLNPHASAFLYSKILFDAPHPVAWCPPTDTKDAESPTTPPCGYPNFIYIGAVHAKVAHPDWALVACCLQRGDNTQCGNPDHTAIHSDAQKTQYTPFGATTHKDQTPINVAHDKQILRSICIVGYRVPDIEVHRIPLWVSEHSNALGSLE